MSPSLLRLVPAVLAALFLPASLPAQGRGGGSWGATNGSGAAPGGNPGGGNGSHGGSVSARGATASGGSRGNVSRSTAAVSRGSGSAAGRSAAPSSRPGVREGWFTGARGSRRPDSAYGSGTNYNGAYALPPGAYPNGARTRNGYVWRSTRSYFPGGYPFFSYGRGGYYPFGGYGWGGDSSDSDTTPRPTQEPGGFSGVLSSNDQDGPRRPAPAAAEPAPMLAAPRWLRPASYPGEVPGKPEASAVVLETQQKLAQRGYYAGPADGNFSADTSLAVASFQSDAGMLITGRIDQRLLEALRR